MKRGLLLVSAACALCALLLSAALAEEWGHNDGLPLVRSAWVYSKPQPSAEAVGQIYQGNVYPIFESKDGWIQVETAEGVIGWTPATAIDYALAIPPEALDRRAVVLVEGLSLREAPSESAKRLVLMPNGSHGYILDEQEGWLYVDYYTRGKTKYERYQGWVQQQYTVETPAYIHLKNRTQVYAFASPYAPVVALTQTGGRFAVIGQVDNYYVISIRSASGFIPMSAPMWTERQVIEGP